MLQRAPLLVSLTLLVALAGSASRSDPAPTRSCFEPPSAGTTWVALDEHTILVRAGPRAFRITTNSCPRLADPLARITVELPGASTICTPHDARIYVSDSADRIPVPCFPQSISQLSQEEARALEDRHKR